MSKVKCEVIRDLMPLVADEVASAGSKELVNHHMEDCESCKAYYAGMTAQLERTVLQKDANFVRFSRKMGKRVGLKRLIAMLIALAFALIVLGVGAEYVWYQMNIEIEMIDDQDAYALLYREKDETVEMWVEMQNGKNWYNKVYTGYQDGVVYLRAYRPALTLWNTGYGTGDFFVEDIDLVWENDMLYHVVYEWDNVFNEELGHNEEIMSERLIPVKYVRWGDPDNFSTIYEQGDILPTGKELFQEDGINKIKEQASLEPTTTPVPTELPAATPSPKAE